VAAEVRLYDRLFTVPTPDQDSADGNFSELLNPESLVRLEECRVEPGLSQRAGEPVQFERTGYFVTDSQDSTPERLVFNRIVSLRDSWAKIEKARAPV
jgi:glutaminyl-tRNA synthetase